MSFFDLLYTILISPLQLVFEIIFVIANRIIGHPAYAIIFLSLAMNFLVLPLYRRADAMQEEARDLDQKLGKGVKHIKSTFSGDEKMMILQTYYRQNNYSPVNGLKGSISLLLEIPFFIAAYQFLSHLIELNGVSFGPIADLSAPDGLITIGALSVNLLPILMTAINLVSSAIFLKGFPLKSKIQLYGMALFFLVFLYNSPAGLVFYWTLNNSFSLVKTIFYKIPNPRKVLSILASAAGIGIIAGGSAIFGLSRPKLLAAFLILGFGLQIPVLLPLLKKRFSSGSSAAAIQEDKKLFTYSCCFITLLTGLLIPSSVISSSPLEFINPYHYHDPLLYLLMSGCLAVGFFIVWFRIFYGLASGKGKSLFETAMFAAAICMPLNYMFFGTDFGKISSQLVYTDIYTMEFTSSEQLLNLLLMAAVVVLCCLLVSKKRSWARSIMLTLCIATAAMSAVNCFTINKSVVQYNDTASVSTDSAQINLSKDGKNVVVLMVDRTYGGYLPYFLEEKPELYELYDGFTFYPNTVSFGSCTNYGVPPVFGGYEYTPVEMNKRSDESLKDKHNEAAKLMPALFYNEGYEVTVCDISHANFKYDPDLSIYDEYVGMHKFNLKGRFLSTERYESMIQANYRNFFCFSIAKSIPPLLQNLLYYQGNYCQASNDFSPQVVRSGFLNAFGSSYDFAEDYSTLDSLPEITVCSDDSENTFLLLCNETSHDGSILQMPDYTQSPIVDNSSFNYSNDFYNYAVEHNDQLVLSFYHANMSTLLRLGEWFDYLREQGVYDNTRIIVVADHGKGQASMEDLIITDYEKEILISEYNPILLVKDFNSTGFNICNDFMTNADVPTLATEGVIYNPVNPFTGKAITSDEKHEHEQFIVPLSFFNIEYEGDGTQYWPTTWLSVSKNIFDHNNWSYYGDELTVLPQAALN